MKDRSSPTRSQVHEIAIDASEEAVWKAIADGEELTRWFVESAKVEPGVGERRSLQRLPRRDAGLVEPDRGCRRRRCGVPTC